MTELQTQPCPRDPVFGREGQTRYQGLTDRLYGVPGKWSFKAGHDLLWLDPSPTPGTVMHAYADYHTHTDDTPAEDTQAPARAGWYHRLRERVWNAMDPDADHASALPLAAHLPIIREQLRFDRAYLEPTQDNRTLLDVGCGSGELLDRMSRLGWRTAGIDPDPKAVEQAQAISRSVSLAGVESLPTMDHTYDAVTLFHVIEHVFEPAKVLRDLADRLNPGGRLVIVTPNAASLCSRVFGRHWRGLEPPRHLQLFNPRSIDRALVDAGFTQRNIRTSPRDASGMCCASAALYRRNQHRPGEAPGFGTRLLGDLTLATEWLGTTLGLPVGEELVAIAEKPAP